MNHADTNHEHGENVSAETLRNFASWFTTEGYAALSEDDQALLTRNDHHEYPETGAYIHRVGVRVDDLRGVTFEVSHAPDGKEDIFIAQFIIRPHTVIFRWPTTTTFAAMVCHGGRMTRRTGQEVILTEAGEIKLTGKTLVDDTLDLDIGKLDRPLEDTGWPATEAGRQLGVRRDAAIDDAHAKIAALTDADLAELPQYNADPEVNIDVAYASIRGHIVGDIVQMLDDFLLAHGLPNHNTYPRPGV